MLMECDTLTRTMRENERLAQEIEIASSIQETLLCSDIPTCLPGIEFAAFTVPSQRVDGDFYDFYQLQDGSIDVLIGDVMGKGIGAALLGVAAKKQFSAVLASQAGASAGSLLEPARIVEHASRGLNKRLIELERFITLCLARFHLPSGQLQFVDCGHTSTIVHRKRTGESLLLRGEDLPFGIQMETTFSQQTFHFLPGDTFLFYSDGVTENVNPDGEFFGEERVIDCVETWSSLGPTALVQRIRQEAVLFCEKEAFSDDFTCIAGRISLHTGVPIEVLRTEFPCKLNQLVHAREWLTEMAALVPGGGLDEESLARLQLACGEAFDNYVVHGSPHPCSLPVRMECWVYEDSLLVHLRHVGPSFDPLKVAAPSFDGSRDNGFGLYIVSRSADELAYSREPDGTNLVSISILRKRVNEFECK